MSHTLTIEKLVYGGDGLARYNGQVVMLPFVLPGEIVQATTVEKRSQLLRARVESWETRSEHRVEAPCKHFSYCGGCHYQQAGYAYQLEQKVAILREVMTRVGKLPPPEEIAVISGEPFAYRNRAQFHLKDGRIGYHEPASHKLRAIEECPILSPKLQETLETLRKMVADRRFPRFVETLEVFSNETDLQLNVLEARQPVAKRFFEWCAEEIPGLVPGALTYEAAGLRFRVSHNAFFQVNRFLVEQLVEEALRFAAGENAIDLYSGVGLFTLPLRKKVGAVRAVESGGAAWRDLQFNAEAAQLPVEALQTSAENFLAANSATADFVLADPPRAGLGKAAVQALVAAKPQRLTIVSCDPATLARDLAALVPVFEIERMAMIDLFPQTYHIETVTHLRLK